MDKILEKMVESHPDARAIYSTENGLLFIADDVKKWHEENINKNEEEYIVNTNISRIKDSLKRNKYRIGYGVVSYDDLTKSLVSCDNLYLASLFHKKCEAIKTNCTLSSNIINNRSQALYMAMISRIGLNTITYLLEDILRTSMRGFGNRIQYVEVNKDILREMFSLYNGNDVYQVYEDKYIMVDYNKLFNRRRLLLPSALNEHFDNAKIKEYNEKDVVSATSHFIKGHMQFEKVLDPLNDTYDDTLIKKGDYRFKR